MREWRLIYLPDLSKQEHSDKVTKDTDANQIIYWAIT
jgi:hypothetical protein